MRYISIRSIIIILSLVVLLFSCSESDSELVVGGDWVNTNTKVYFLDTISVKSSTFKMDTLNVESAERFLIGAYQDPIFGSIKAKTYLQLSPSNYSIANDVEYDSIVLVLKYDNYFYNDTIPTQGIKVYEVTEDIETDDEDYPYFYNTTEFEHSTTPIANLDFLYRPNKIGDSLHVTLNDNFGVELFNKIKENEINNNDDFLDEYKGLFIEPKDDNTTIFGFSNTSYVRLYYSTDVELTSEEEGLLYSDFSINTTNSFHNITSNLQNTTLQSLQTGNTEISSYDTGDKSYLQGGIGIATKIDIPNIKSIYDIKGTGVILSANLQIALKKDINADILTTRDSLQLYIIDDDYNVVDLLYAYDGSDGVAYGEIESEDDEFNITTYSIPINYFLTQKLSSINGDELYLAIYPQEYTQSVDRYVFYNENASNDVKLKVEIIYTVYDE